MYNHQATPAHALGLSVGATNLAGTRDGQTAVVRPSEATLHGQRLTGFVDRIGDPVPLVAPDGSNHRPEQLLAMALGAVARSAAEGVPASQVAVAVPAHWRPSVVDTLRRDMRDEMLVVSDATAALTALSANPGLPTRGVIALCDFGGSGSSITLANASSNYAVVGETVRVADFSGDHIDQALLTHVASTLTDASHADPSGTAMVGSLVRLRDECRHAKERLSEQTATAVPVDLPGHREDIRVTRTELEGLIQGPFANFLAALDDTLERYGVPAASVAAVATVGGGARIPLITQLLSEHLRAPVVTTAQPQLTAAQGAALIAGRSRVIDAPTTIAPVVAPTAEATSGALAWSEAGDAEEELPYTPVSTESDYRPEVVFQQRDQQDDEPPRRTPLVLFGLSAAAAVITTGVFAFMQFGPGAATTPVEAATTVAPSQAPAAPAPTPANPAPQAPEVTTVVVPAQRYYPAPQRQAPVTQAPAAPSTVAAPPSSPEPPPSSPEPPPSSPEPPPSSPEPPPSSPEPPPADPPAEPPSPEPPPIDPGPGDGESTPGGAESGTETPPIDPGPGDGETVTDPPPIDPGTGGGP